MTNQNGNGATDGGQRPDYPEPDDADSGALHDLAVDLLRELNPGANALASESIFGTLVRAAYAGYAVGYWRCRRDLRAGAIPIKLGKDIETVIHLEGEESENVLKSFGLLPE